MVEFAIRIRQLAVLNTHDGSDRAEGRIIGAGKRPVLVVEVVLAR